MDMDSAQLSDEAKAARENAMSTFDTLFTGANIKLSPAKTSQKNAVNPVKATKKTPSATVKKGAKKTTSGTVTTTKTNVKKTTASLGGKRK